MNLLLLVRLKQSKNSELRRMTRVRYLSGNPNESILRTIVRWIRSPHPLFLNASALGELIALHNKI